MAAAHNPRRFLVACPGLIGPGAPVALMPVKEAVIEGWCTARLESGALHVAGALTGTYLPNEVFLTVERISGRLRAALWLHRAMERLHHQLLPIASLGPTWERADEERNTWFLRGTGWSIAFVSEIGWLRGSLSAVLVPSLLDFDPKNDCALPDGSSSHDALALKLACETVGCAAAVTR